ncbi:MAG: Mov34/MPN/PAD-1 family protein [Oscillospiraceae bacterium]|nr:Mov34/MPN/PAD-1 family protein [Oscillospiraceae bacterium]
MMHEFQSDDKQFGIRVSDENLMHFKILCTKYSTRETGGILIGHYSPDLHWAEIDEITGPPQDSIHRATTFIRGKHSILSKLDKLWHREEYYLGEWHYHPNASPLPSATDKQTMFAISKSKELFCPEPILIIVGNLNLSWQLHVSVFVGNSEIVLKETPLKQPQEVFGL